MNALSNQAHWDNLVSAFPQLRRQFVGFDRVFDLLNQNFEAVSYTHLTLPTICSV